MFKITRRDWWIGVGLIVLALLVHALVPRYEYRNATPNPTRFVRIDRWTGGAQRVRVGDEGVIFGWSQSR